MTRTIQSNVIALGVLGLGLTAWTVAGRSLHREGKLNYAPNVLHLKGSPFGRTIAMAMQGPADVYFHEGESHEGHDHAPGESCTHNDGPESQEPAAIASSESDRSNETEGFVPVATAEHIHTEACEHDHSAAEPVAPATHNHGPGEDCITCDHDQDEDLAAASLPDRSLRQTILGQIREWRAAANTRTNPFGNTAAHKFYIRHEIEKKLFLSYQMDPTNYASYGAYFLFLHESSLGTRKNSLAHARRLAEMTTACCMQEQENPLALLTAAVASHDMIEVLIEIDSPEFTSLAPQYAAVTGHCLKQFRKVASQMAADGTWERFSAVRQKEMSERVHLLHALHRADRKILDSSVNNSGSKQGTPEVPAG